MDISRDKQEILHTRRHFLRKGNLKRETEFTNWSTKQHHKDQ